MVKKKKYLEWPWKHHPLVMTQAVGETFSVGATVERVAKKYGVNKSRLLAYRRMFAKGLRMNNISPRER